VILSEIGMEPRGTLSKSVAALIAVSDTIDFIGDKSFLLRHGGIWHTFEIIVSPEEIVDIHAEELIVPFVVVVIACLCIHMRGHIELVPVPDTAGCLDLIEKVLGDKVHVHQCLREPHIRILVACCVPIANNEASKVIGAIGVPVHRLLLVPDVDLPSQVGTVDPRIALSSDIKRVVSVTWESHVEILEGGKGILRL
jgi:hypothetical protein